MTLLPRNSNLPQLASSPRDFARTYRLSLAILFIGATADVVTTWVNLRRFGPSVESHVVQRWVSEIVGVDAGVPLAKLAQLAFVLFVAAWWRPWTPWLLTLCGLLYAAAAVSNHFLLI
jgi:hypothetical protein